MYDTYNNYERALRQFSIQVGYICAAEMAGRIDSEEAYQRIKTQLKVVKKVRKSGRTDVQ